MFDNTLWQIRTDFQNSFTNWFIRKFSMYTPQRFLPHLQFVATLPVPCEIWKLKNVGDFSGLVGMWQCVCWTVSGVVSSFSHECDYYSQHNCNSGVGQCRGTQLCDAVEPGKRSHCYAFWNNVSGVADVILKGCWLDTPECYNRTACVATHEQTPSAFFCCCERTMCNIDFSVARDVILLSASPTHLPRGNLQVTRSCLRT